MYTTGTSSVTDILSPSSFDSKKFFKAWQNRNLDAVNEQLNALNSNLSAKTLALNAIDNYGHTPLMLASQHGWAEVVKVLLDEDEGADVNAQNSDGSTALMVACSHNIDTKVTEVLLDGGADVNAKDRVGITPLLSACFSLRTENIKTLLAHGADATVKDSLGRTAASFLDDYPKYWTPPERKSEVLSEISKTLPFLLAHGAAPEEITSTNSTDVLAFKAAAECLPILAMTNHLFSAHPLPTRGVAHK